MAAHLVNASKIAKQLRNIGQVVFKRDSVVYGLGTAVYRRLRPVLRRISPDERSAMENAAEIAAIARASQLCTRRDDAKRIVFLTVRGWRPLLATEAVIGARLRQMGHQVSFLICAESLSFCMFSSVNDADPTDQDCFGCGHAKAILPGPYFETDQLHCPEESKRTLQNSVGNLGIEQCRQFEWESVPYGELVYPSIVWFLRRSKLTEDDAPLYRKALVSAHTTRIGVERMVAQREPDTVVLLNGDFNVEKVASFVFKRLGVRYVTYDYTFHERVGVAANVSVWDDLTFSDESRVRPPVITKREQTEAEELLKQWRRNGGYQGELFWKADDPHHAENSVREELGLDSRPLAVAFTNLTFESSVLGKDRTFNDQFEWLSALIGWFERHPSYQLAIRIHPAEVRQDHWRPNESLYKFIVTSLTPLPQNVHVIPPSAKLSSYALGALAQVILVYSSTLGLEMAERRKRVITAAHVHYAGRGFTSDPASEKEYFEILEQYLQNESMLSEKDRNALVNYVGWFMFRRLATFEPLSLREDWSPVHVKSLDDLSNSELIGFQQVCRLIADGTSWW